MKDLFTIGEIAKLFDINIRTLRYYDEIDLLKPEHIDSTTNYRYYSTGQFERLNTIKYLRALDMPLIKVQEFFMNKKVDTLVTILRQQEEAIQVKKQELELIERKIRNRLRMIEDSISSDFDHMIEKRIPARRIAILKRNIKVDEDIEYPIIELGSSNQLNTAIFLGKVALSISKEDLMLQRFDEFSYVMVIIEDEDGGAQSTQNIPEGNYLTLRYPGTHSASKEYYLRMFEYMKQKNYTMDGDSIEITMIDYGMTNDPSKFVTELQLPYKNSLDSL